MLANCLLCLFFLRLSYPMSYETEKKQKIELRALVKKKKKTARV